MRTITENLFNRLLAQAQEAELQGLSKIAEGLTDQIEKNSHLVRKDDSFYLYNEEEFRNDLNSQLWNIIIRAADFYGVGKFDAVVTQELIDKTAQILVEDFCNTVGINHGVGAYEENVPGELIGRVDIEITEE
jgi:hypothetical protein